NPLLNIDFNHPHITVDAGAEILAQADGAFTPGDVTLKATNTNYTLDGLTFPSIGLTKRAANITFADGTGGGDAALVKGGAINITATSGDVPVNSLLASKGKNSNNSYQSWGTWVNGLLSSAIQITNVLPLINLAKLPVSVNYRNASTSVTVGQFDQIVGSGDV